MLCEYVLSRQFFNSFFGGAHQDTRAQAAAMEEQRRRLDLSCKVLRYWYTVDREDKCANAAVDPLQPWDLFEQFGGSGGGGCCLFDVLVFLGFVVRTPT